MRLFLMSRQRALSSEVTVLRVTEAPSTGASSSRSAGRPPPSIHGMLRAWPSAGDPRFGVSLTTFQPAPRGWPFQARFPEVLDPGFAAGLLGGPESQGPPCGL